MSKNIEVAQFQPENFHESLSEVLSRPLTPETIDTYADEALDELVDLTERATAAYDAQPTLRADSATESEDAAFSYFGIGELEEALDHVAELAKSIHSIDSLIENATVRSGVIVPPNKVEVDIRPGDGTFNQKNNYERLKTTLFILDKDFGVDIHDSNKLLLTSGGTEGIMRNASYNLVEVPELERAILVCDEEGNVTYVFDSGKLADQGTHSRDLMDLTKEELNSLIENFPGIGRRIVYTGYFIQHMKDSVGSDISAPNSNNVAPQVQVAGASTYLRPAGELPEGHLGIAGVADKFDVSRNVVYAAVETLKDKLGEVAKGRFGPRTADAYSPEQIEIIRSYLADENKLADRAPEGFLSLRGIADNFNVSQPTVRKAIDSLEQQLGTVPQLKFGARITDAYSPEQIEIIRSHLVGQDKIAKDRPEGYQSLGAIGKDLDIHEETVADAVKALKSELGYILEDNFGMGRPTKAYSPTQIDMIKTYLGENGRLTPKAPEGYLSAGGIAEKFGGIGDSTVKSAIEALGADLGEVVERMFGSRTTSAYSPEQIDMIQAQLHQMGILNKTAPEGYLSRTAIAEALGIDSQPVHLAISALKPELGDILKVKLGARRPAEVYSPEQQAAIVKKIREDNKRKTIGSIALG